MFNYCPYLLNEVKITEVTLCQVGVHINLTSGGAVLNVRIGFVLLFIDIFHQR